MIKRFYITILVLILGISLGFSQNPEVKLNSVTNASNGPILVHVDMTNFTANVNSISIQFNFDPTQLTFTGITNIVGFTGLQASLVGNVVKIGYFNTTGYMPNGRVFDVAFNYIGSSSTPLVWETPQCSISYGWVSIPNITYINGTVSPPVTANPVVQIMNKVTAPGSVNVPVHMINFSQTVNSFTYKINFDACLLTFIGVVNKVPELTTGFSSIVIGNEITVSWFNTTGFIPSGQIFDLRFDYIGGFDALLNFGAGNSVTYGTVQVPGISYVMGTVSQVAELGTVSLPSQNSPSPGSVTLPLHFEGAGYSSVSAFGLVLNYDPAKVSFVQLVSPLVTDIIVNSSVPGVLQLSWFGAPQSWTNHDITGLKFNYTGVSCADISFKCGSYVGDQLAVKVASSFSNGAICPLPSEASLDISDVTACAGSSVTVPIVATNMGTVAGIEMHISYDGTKLSYSGFTAQQLSGWIVGQQPNALTFTWLGLGTPAIITNGNLLSLNFVYNGGGCAPVTFGSASTVTKPDLTTLNVNWQNGGVCGCTSNQTATIATVTSCSSTAIVPITLSNVALINTLDFKIGFGTGLTFVSLQNVNPLLTGLSVNVVGNQINISWFSGTPVDANGVIMELKFSYSQGVNIPVTFNPGTVLGNALGQPIPVQFIDGEVHCNNQYRILTVEKHQTGNVEVKDGATVVLPINGTTDQYSVIYGTVLTVIATPVIPNLCPNEWVFNNWTGPVASTSSFTTTVTMDADKTIKAWFYRRGDADGSGVVNVGDINALVNYIMGNGSQNPTFIPAAADADGSGIINVGDITKTINIIFGICPQ